MSFENDYNDLLEFAKSIIIQKNIYASHTDVVNDAYISHIDSGSAYIKNDVKKKIYSNIINEQSAKSVLVKEDFNNIHFPKETNRHCKGCNELKPLSGFYKNQITQGRIRDILICKDCTIKKQMKYYNANKDKCLSQSKKYKEENKERIRLQKKLYHINKKNQLRITSSIA